MTRRLRRLFAALTLGALTALGFGHAAEASSHREAPAITEMPKVDGTDFYMFRSYEPGREDYVTLVANYLPLQDPYGGPNYFFLDDNALYEIHIDNNGDAIEDITFQFRFQKVLKDIQLSVGAPGEEKLVSVPLVNVGPFGSGDTNNLNVEQRYTVNLVQGDRRTGTSTPIAATDATTSFTKPVDNIGQKSIPDYDAYAGDFMYDISLPGGGVGRMFVGQRKDPFVVNLGETFDLINTNPLGAENGEADDLADKNVTAFCLELPISFLTQGTESVIGGWTTASLRQARVLNPKPAADKKPAVHGGAFTQVSRLSAPLINEVIIGLKDKDKFNASEPKDDAQFLDYVTHPTLPELIQILFGSAGVEAPNLFPRDDLVAAFLTGVSGLNQPDSVVPSEMLRLNTAIAVTPMGSQQRHGVIAGDLAGFPNGRRPGDDVVDIELRVAMGVLVDPLLAPSGQLPFTDGALVDDSFFDNAFPYLKTPLPGSPN
ncbi:MAG: DUF4331 domain-containing protein [Planctomycetota bacterium]|nr:DUF4331 domain-containing protein [Planctomycetota bacterium]